MLAYICASLLSGVMVVVSSAIGFFRLMLPHLARRFIGAKHRQPLPVAALLGGLFLLWIDMAAHTLFTSDDLPTGIATAVLGGGTFLYLGRNDESRKHEAFARKGIHDSYMLLDETGRFSRLGTPD